MIDTHQEGLAKLGTALHFERMRQERDLQTLISPAPSPQSGSPVTTNRNGSPKISPKFSPISRPRGSSFSSPNSATSPYKPPQPKEGTPPRARHLLNRSQVYTFIVILQQS